MHEAEMQAARHMHELRIRQEENTHFRKCTVIWLTSIVALVGVVGFIIMIYSLMDGK
jgi:nitrate reductase NapE component